MKAEELMIGDLVLSTSISKPVRVIGIDPMEGLGQREGYTFKLSDGKGMVLFVHAVSVKPIPLTDEMLTNWGFKKNKAGQWAIEKKHPIGCCGQTCSNTNPLEYAVWVDKYGYGCVSYLEKEGNLTISGPCYVHNLQHLLRIFGLDEYVKIEL